MPPLVGVAVNVTLAPAQVGFVPDVMAMLTLAGKFGLIVILLPLSEPVMELVVLTTRIL